ncbi:LysM domain protein [Botrimarina colliarenosi]|uniref:LysM domain protein n=2 Tax=Botrimarina colliarenosi TaxID=2528001 RepID=A0A5C6ACU3_9BACT|nr:LysM domain protein [Botrimarina colliarenosi]
MSTIRPLATIAVLAALGVFLAFKINEGPPVALNEGWGAASEDAGDEPPAWEGDTSAEDTSLEARSAPSWADSSTEPKAATPAATPAFPALPSLPGSGNAKPAPPTNDLPPIQGVPVGSELATQPGATPSTSANQTTSSNQALPLPASIPQANYGDNAATVTSPTITGRVPSLQTANSVSSPPGQAAVPSAPGFDAAWQAVEMALERNELPRAHRMLSQWRAEPNLSPEQRGRVETLLGQLAGTVVYSTEHLLEPAHTVQPGETLATIAEDYNVPWQLLAKINGVASTDAVQPGQPLKVMRGPFDAEVDLARGELVVLLDERYAGRFPIRVEGQAPPTGEWRVGQKRLDAPDQPIIGAGPKVVLESSTGEQVELSAGPTPPVGSRGRLTIASNDLADLYDILSVGSTVTLRR